MGALLTLPLAVACGDGDGDSSATSAPTQTNLTDERFTAADLIPDLQSDGFKREESGRPEGASPAQDVHFALFSGEGAIAAVRLETSRLATRDEASAQFSAFAEALRNPPPDLFGPNASQSDGVPVYQADQSRSYVTTAPDGEGNLVYTDIHRFDRAIAIIYLIASDEDEAATLREQLADWMHRQVNNQ